MVTETRTDYETVEKEYEVTICDCCKETKDDDQIEQVAVNPEYERNRQARMQFPNWVDAHHGGAKFIQGLPPMHRDGTWEEAEMYEEAKALRQEVAKLHTKVVDLKTLPKGKLAADCTRDVCHACLEGFLDVKPSGDDIETPRIVERDLEVDHPKLIDGRTIFAAFVLSLIGAGVLFLGLGSYLAGLLAGVALTVTALYLIQIRRFDQ